MRFDSWINGLIIPFGQSFIYDIAKYIFLEKTNYSTIKIKKSFDKAIEKGVLETLCNKKLELALAIIEAIKKSCKKNDEQDIHKLVKCKLSEWGEENLDARLISAQICDNITQKIVADPELCEVLNYLNIKDLIRQFYKLASKIEYDNSHMQESMINLESETRNIQLLVRELISCINQIDNKMSQINQATLTNEYIPKDYREYFLKPLCFERNLNDGLVVSLKDVYIENDYRILDFPFYNKTIVYSNLVNFIKDFINSNLLENNYHTKYNFLPNHIKVLFIKGHPGSGKSSLFYYLAFLKSQDETFFFDYKFYFIKLIEVYDAKNGNMNMEDPLKDFIESGLIHNIYSEKSVIVLDGLDEICVARNLDINIYCNNLIRKAATQKKLKIIITTRLNYINISHSDNKNVFNIQLLNLSPDHLDKWVDKYFNIHNTLIEWKEIAKKNIKYIVGNPNKELGDIFAIPFLFYMIVTSKINLSKIGNIGELYDHVFEELSERNYNESESDFIQKHGINSKIPEKLARQIAIEISFEMYKHNKLLIKVNSDELNNAINNALNLNYSINKTDKTEIERLFPITFFYKNAVDVVEFAHKSIMEFLSAEKLYQELLKSNGQINEFIKKYILNPIIITNEVLEFFKFFTKWKNHYNVIEKLSSNVLTDFKTIIKSKDSFQNKNIKYSFETSKIIFKFYWLFIREIIEYKTNVINNVINDEIVKNYIIGVLSIKDSKTLPFLDNSVINYDFSELLFEKYNFEFCDLSFFNFENAVLYNCFFEFSNLSYVNFSNLNIKGFSRFISCNLSNAKLKNIKFKKDEDTINPILEFKGCSLDNATVADLDITKINFISIVSMIQTKFENITMNYEQLKKVGVFPVIFRKVTVILKKDEFSSDDCAKLQKFKNDQEEVYRIIKKKMPNSFNKDLINNIHFNCEF